MLPVARHPNTPTNPTLETSPSAYFPYNAIEVLPAPGHRTDDPVGKIYTTHITARPTDNALESLKTYGYGPDAAVVVRNSAWSLARKPLALGSIDVAGDPQGFTLKGSTTGPVVGYTPDDPDTV